MRGEHGGTASEVDVELWDEAVKLMHTPQLKELFAPVQSGPEQEV